MDEEKKGFEIDPSTIRSGEQYEQTKVAAKCGCAWCLSDEKQKSPLLFDLGLVRVRKNAFLKKHRIMYIIHTVRHARGDELTPDEAYQVFQARARLIAEENLRGGAEIHRFGENKFNASSLPDAHYFESVVVPDGTGPVAETLFKDQSPEKVAEREARAKTFTK